MTREEAIKNREDCLKYLEECGPKASTDCLEAVRWSVKALKALRPVSREQLERTRGAWEAKSKRDKATFACSGCGHLYGAFIAGCANFCPNCGQPKTDKAVDMVMKRLEALKDGKGD